MRIFLVCLAVFLAGCVISPVPKEKMANVSSIGVASICAQRANRESIALMVFGNETTDGDISDWGIDDRVVTWVAATVRPGIKVEKVDVDFAAIDLSGTGYRSPKSLWADRFRAAIHGPRSPYDLYILVSPTIDGQGIDLKRGVGIFSHGPIGAMAHTYCAVDVVDGKTFEWIAHDWTAGGAGVPADLHQDRWSEYTDEQKTRIKTVLSYLLQTSLTNTLTKMNLNQ